jgi:hypothetical protein
MILTDEIARRDNTAADNRATEAGLDPHVQTRRSVEAWAATFPVADRSRA